jgi:hypothetical protein
MLSAAVNQDPILQLDVSDTERYSIRKWCGTRQKNPLEINHAMRATNFAMEHFPLQPLQQVQVSIRTCENFKQTIKIF